VSYTPSQLRLARERDRALAKRRSTLMAICSTVAFGLVIAFVLSRSSGLKAVQQSFFSPHYFAISIHPVLSGIWLNFRVMLVTEFFVLIFGSLIALARTSRSPVLYPLRLLAVFYTDLFRGAPLLLILYLVGFGVPGLNFGWIPNSTVVLGTIALTLTYSAYVGEVLRAGIDAVATTQTMAARALGLKQWQTARYVVFPQALRKVIPPLLNDLVSLQKDSGLISVLGAIDAIRSAEIVKAQYYNFTPYIVAGVAFILLTIPLTRFTDWITKKQDLSRTQRGNW
jgi:polar amino acid transport system permease protein